ncbi:MAG: mechanosensitive ion channel family protein [Proteobacteria bacterium]|nr:mechanosensitive ion channel family protein [Pseudomonadota bacterium]
MNALQKICATVLVLFLAIALYGRWSTREPTRPQQTTPGLGTSRVPLIDESALRTAQRLARLASTPEEQSFAQAAVQAANHELDLAFMGALDDIQAHPPVLSPAALAAQARIAAAQRSLESDTELLGNLAQRMGKATETEKPDLQDQLDLVGSRIEIEKDEIEEAHDDLMAAGGNVHQRIQNAQEEHLAAERDTSTPVPTASVGALSSLHGMVAQGRQWLGLRGKRRALEEARLEVAEGATKLSKQREEIASDFASVQRQLASLGKPVEATGPSPVAPPAPAAGTAAGKQSDRRLGLTRQYALDQRSLMVRDKRITARKKLADIYSDWGGVVAAQQRAVLREWLAGAAIVVTALLLLLFADRSVARLLGRAVNNIDRRQYATLRSVVGVALQVVAVLVILFMLIGVPGQVGTMLGLAGAGLTVALKDFIVAFIGWFVLMGKNGIRIGDWVEINGVTGEVVELSVFHTVLHETGNWTDPGHPTGRRVTFTNSFAIEGHYFNFSTTGQWLWDELRVVVPSAHDPQTVANALQKEATEATAENSRKAEQEWQIASRGTRGTTLSANPSIAVRPAAGGVEIAVRYVARASDRYALRERLYQAAVKLLGEKPAA